MSKSMNVNQNYETVEIMNAHRWIMRFSVAKKICEMNHKVLVASCAEFENALMELKMWQSLEHQLEQTSYLSDFEYVKDIFYGQKYYPTCIIENPFREKEVPAVIKSLRKARIAVKRDIRSLKKQVSELESQMQYLSEVIKADNTDKDYWTLLITREEMIIAAAELKLKINPLEVQLHILERALRDLKEGWLFPNPADYETKEVIA